MQVNVRPPTTVNIASKSPHVKRSSLLGSSLPFNHPNYQPLGSISGASTDSRAALSRDFSPYGDRTDYTPGGYHDRQGHSQPSNTPGIGNASTTRKMYRPDSTWTWVFALVALFQAIISLALEGYVFAVFQTSLVEDIPNEFNETRTIPTYLALFIFGFLYMLWLVWDALKKRNTIQVMGLCLYDLGLLIYSAVQIDQVREAVAQLRDDGHLVEGEEDLWAQLRPFLYAEPCVIGLGMVLLSITAWKLYDEFAWSIYKNVSADLRLKRRYLTYQIYLALLKFDFFFFVGFTVQFLVVVRNTTSLEFYLTIAALVLTACTLFLAAWVTRSENKYLMCVIIFLYLAAMAYFVFKLVRMYANPSDARKEDYKPARTSLTVFAVMTVLALLVTILIAAVCMANFGKGLKPIVQKRSRKDRERAQEDLGKWGAYGGDAFGGPPGATPLGQVGSRMTID
ncbi:hypothetical protein MBLNU230_g5459t1 [Neophaeotheca triangularis]